LISETSFLLDCGFIRLIVTDCDQMYDSQINISTEIEEIYVCAYE